MKKGTDEKSLSFVQNALFSFQGKVEISIHFSLISDKLQLIFRVVAFLVLSFRYFLQLQKLHSFFSTFEYFTELGFHLTWLYFSSVCLDYLLNEMPASKRSKKLKNWVNLIYEIAWCIEFPVTIIYWSILYSPNASQTTEEQLQNIGVHGFPLFCLFLDFLMNVYQFPKKHLFVVLLVGLGYMFVNMGYTLATRPVYDPIDWVSFMSYVWIVACSAIIVGVHLLSDFIWLRFKKEKLQEEGTMTQSSHMITMVN